MNAYKYAFPHPFLANQDGFLCVGGDLEPQRLLTAYQYGIFPWYSDGQPILWWYTSPRMVLFPVDLKVSKSMRNVLNQKKFTITMDTAFEQVISQCKQTPRMGQEGTWINPDMIAAYTSLHEIGYAHSVEVWEGQTLVGGLYGLAIGKIFYGESMFAHRSNASKVAFVHLVRHLQQRDFTLIDCQQETPHLRSLGADIIQGDQFMDILRKNVFVEHHIFST